MSEEFMYRLKTLVMKIIILGAGFMVFTALSFDLGMAYALAVCLYFPFKYKRDFHLTVFGCIVAGVVTLLAIVFISTVNVVLALLIYIIPPIDIFISLILLIVYFFKGSKNEEE